jgi:hypothetical protein
VRAGTVEAAVTNALRTQPAARVRSAQRVLSALVKQLALAEE